MSEEQGGSPSPPLVLAATGISSMAAFGTVDLLIHAGLPGGIAAGIITAILAYRHGPQALAWVTEASASPAPVTCMAQDEPAAVSGPRSVLDRVLGRFPASPGQQAGEVAPPALVSPQTSQSEQDADPPHSLEDAATPTGRAGRLPDALPRMPVLPRSLPREEAGDAQDGRAARQDSRLHLAPDWHPDIEDIIGLGIVCYGVKGSGKTNTGALCAEQIGRAYVPFVVFDLEGDYRSVAEVVPNGSQAGGQEAQVEADSSRYLTIDEQNAGEMAAVILSGGYQVVVDLASYPDDETRATIMTRLVSGLMRYAESLPNDKRVPCLVFIDEAAHWFPQQAAMSYLSPAAQSALTRAVFEMVTMGRKRGIIPAFFTQRPADFDKRLAAQADLLILMRQRQDVDLKRYREYLGEQAEQAASFGRGEAVVIPPDDDAFVTTFYPRQSQHLSHTPTAEAAYRRFAKDAPARMRPGEKTAMGRSHRQRFTPARGKTPPDGAQGGGADLPVRQARSMQPPPSNYQRGLEAWNEGHNSIRKLAQALDLNFNQARDVINALHQRGLINKYAKEDSDEVAV